MACQEPKTKRLLWISPRSPRDARQWSGIPYFLYGSLEREALAAGWKCRHLSAGPLDFAARAANRLLRQLGSAIDCRFSSAYAVLSGTVLSLRLLFAKDAVLVAVAASNILPYLRTSHPILYISDATFHAISDFYPAFRAFPRWLKRAGDRNEQRTLCRARFAIYPSRWAAQSAERDYGVPAAHIAEIPFGPNIPPAMIEEYRVEKNIDAGGEVVLLFVSADWQRKNGDMAIAIGQALRAAGVEARLVLVGDAPEHVKDLPFVAVLGVLRKSDPAQLRALCEAYGKAHFLLLPSTADASPVVFSEAQAFAVPSIAYDVGGVGSAVLDGETGILLPPGSEAQDFAAAILACARDARTYRRLSQNCLQRYRREANWDAWAQLILQLAAELSSRPAQAARSHLAVRQRPCFPKS